MSNIKFDGVQNAAYNIGGTVILATAMILLLLQLPHIASGLAGGAALGYLWELRALRSGTAQVAAAGKSVARAGYAVDRAGYSAGRAGVVAAGRGVAGAGRAAVGYYRGRKAA